jgi:hypothetical protein
MFFLLFHILAEIVAGGEDELTRSCAWTQKGEACRSKQNEEVKEMERNKEEYWIVIYSNTIVQ